MSKVAITGNASGTGTFTIAAPNSNTDRTLTLPDQTGTILTSATTTGFPAGSVLQVVSATSSTAYTTTSGTYQDTNIQASITPSSASSKILVLCSIFAGGDFGGDDVEALLRLDRSGTTAVTWGGNYWVGVGATRIGGQLALCGNYLDSPATTSSRTYKIQFAAGAGGTAYINAGGTKTSTITLMEIAG